MAKKRVPLGQRNQTFLDREEPLRRDEQGPEPDEVTQPAPEPPAQPAKSPRKTAASRTPSDAARPVASQPVEEARTAASQPSPSATPQPARAEPSKRRTSGKSTSGVGEGTNPSVILYLPDDLLDPLRTYRTVERLTNTQVALRALNMYYQRVDELLLEESTPQVVPGALFDEVVPRPSVPKRQVEITPTAAQLNVIDQTRQGTQAPDRSHMFALVLRQLLRDAGQLQ